MWSGCEQDPTSTHRISQLAGHLTLVLALCPEHLRQAQNRGDQELRVSIIVGERTRVSVELLVPES